MQLIMSTILIEGLQLPVLQPMFFNREYVKIGAIRSIGIGDIVAFMSKKQQANT